MTNTNTQDTGSQCKMVRCEAEQWRDDDIYCKRHSTHPDSYWGES